MNQVQATAIKFGFIIIVPVKIMQLALTFILDSSPWLDKSASFLKAFSINIYAIKKIYRFNLIF